MSRIGSRLIKIPEGVTVENNDNVITVKGPKGTLSREISKDVKVDIKDNEIKLAVDDPTLGAIHGTMNALINNMVVGVTKGYEKGLEIVGVGYRFNVRGNKLVINAGYSHPVELDIPEGITVEAKENTEITLKSIDKEKIGEFAAKVRKVRKPEPYKGKGIKYTDEHIRRKEGKKAA